MSRLSSRLMKIESILAQGSPGQRPTVVVVHTTATGAISQDAAAGTVIEVRTSIPDPARPPHITIPRGV